ncbi:hypothetical protein [Lysobacter sp. FW306-1B-D06B]|uniref:hypothetical protein n=1 Tax=Lysobacter sp. FW306-1B-D06B TaxID=3140250 RepID=UPI003140A321
MNPKFLFCTLALLCVSVAHAGMSDVVPLGKGRYMIGGKSATVFGNTSKMQGKAMKVANDFCAEKKPGTEAVMESAQGQRGQMGTAYQTTDGAWGGGGAKQAEIEVIFTCEKLEEESP